MKSTIFQMQNILYEINNILDTAEENISEFTDSQRKISNIVHKKKKG